MLSVKNTVTVLVLVDQSGFKIWGDDVISIHLQHSNTGATNTIRKYSK